MGLLSSRRYRGAPVYGPTVIEPAVPGRVGGFGYGGAAPFVFPPVAPVPSFVPPPIPPAVSVVNESPIVPYTPYNYGTTGLTGAGASTSVLVPSPSMGTYGTTYPNTSGVGMLGNFGGNIGSYGGGVGFGVGTGRPYGGYGSGYGTYGSVGSGYGGTGYGSSTIAVPQSYPTSVYLPPPDFPPCPPVPPVPPVPSYPQPMPTCDSESYIVTIRMISAPCPPPPVPIPPAPQPMPPPMPCPQPHPPVWCIPVVQCSPSIQPSPAPVPTPVPMPMPQPSYMPSTSIPICPPGVYNICPPGTYNPSSYYC